MRRYRRVIRLAKRVFVSLLAVVFFLLVLPNLLLQIPAVKEAVVDRAEEELSEALQTEVCIGRVSLAWWRQIELNEIRISDRSGRPMLGADRLTAGLELMPLLRGRWVFSSARLFGGELHIDRARPDTALNIQFVLDALKSKNPEKPSGLHLNINTILLRDCRLSAVGLLAAQQEAVELEHLNTKIRLFEVYEDYIRAEIRHLSFGGRQSGFELANLRADIALGGDTLSLKNLWVDLPHSRLALASARYIRSMDKKRLPLIELERLDGTLRPSDGKAFLAGLDGLDEDLSVQAASLRMNGGEIALSDVRLEYGEDIRLGFDGRVINPTVWEQMLVHLRLEELKLNRAAWAAVDRWLSVPEPLWQLDRVDVMAALEGKPSDMNVKARMESDAGALTVQGRMGFDRDWQLALVNGRATTTGLAFKQFFPGDQWPEQAAFDLQLSGKRGLNNLYSGVWNGRISNITLRGYTYEDLTINGRLDAGKWRTQIAIKDPDGFVRLSSAGEGLPFSSPSSSFEYALEVRDLHTDRLSAAVDRPAARAGLVSSGRLQGNTLDNLNGQVYIDSLDWVTEDKSLHLYDIDLALCQKEAERILSIQSPYVSGSLRGRRSFLELPDRLMALASGYLPDLLQKEAPASDDRDDEHLLLSLDVRCPKDLSDFFRLPLADADSIRIVADYWPEQDLLDLSLTANRVAAMNREWRHAMMSLKTSSLGALLTMKSDIYEEGLPAMRGLLLQASAAHDTIRTQLDLGEDAQGRRNGLISLLTGFKRNEDATLNTYFNLDSSFARIGGVDWKIASADALVSPERVTVNNLSMKSPGRMIEAEGVLSGLPSDSLSVRVENIGLRYILDLAGVDFDMIDVDMTGRAVFSDIGNRQVMKAGISGKELKVNGVNMGPVTARASWRKAEQKIMLDAAVHNDDGTETLARGYIRPLNPHAGLDLTFDAAHTNVAFVGPFLSDFCHKLEGRASGWMRLFGDFSDLTIEGDITTEDVRFGVKALNTEYLFDQQRLLFTPNEMRFDNILACDPEGHTARVDVTVGHQSFSDIRLDLKVRDAQKILAYNMDEHESPNVYGKAYVSGFAYLHDVPGGMRCDANLISERGTSIGLNFTQPTTAEEYRFLRFVDHHNRPSDASNESSPLAPAVLEEDADESDFHLVLNLDVTPDAAVKLMLDPQTGGGIQGLAEGNIRIDYHTLGDIGVYGGVKLLSGSYDFNLKQIVQKRFSIKEGSRVDFVGDPMNAMLDVSAEYSLTANLMDLDEALVSDLRRTNIPVNCLLTLNGPLLHPTIGFDVKLPNSDSELERRVRSLIHSEDSMTKQIVYLLVLGKFYTPENVYNTGAGTDSWTAVATTTLSQQLSNILGALTDKMQIGTSIKTTNSSFQDTDIELLLSSQLLNNRLLINGNVGYKDNPNLHNTYVGEFDAEYKINPSGSIRVKAYNHYNNLYQYLRQSLTTQGIGLVFKYDFDRLFPRKRPLVKPMQVDSLPPLPAWRKQSAKSKE